MASEPFVRGIKRKSDDHQPLLRDVAKHDSAGLSDATVNPKDLAEISQKLEIVPVPEDGDTLEETVAKMRELANVVREGNSLALFTGLKASPAPHTPEEIAKAQMSPEELMQYEAWQEMRRHHGHVKAQGLGDTAAEGATGPGMRTFDWETNVAAVPQGAQSEKKFRQRAAAMDVVWDHRGARPEHAAWLTFNVPQALPLVKAVTKVLNITRHSEANAPYPGLTGTEVAELETVRRIISVAERNRNREMERIRRATRSINDSVAVIKSRIQMLEKS
ncbi:hypothetical protein BDV59DRAFT_187904 [Aspergillus ambiguus]|uniref:uncharacterized protein n=1 Tax=Aspergillus ambiguus TaxID=176160 RepID=UPI003CCCB9E9